MQKGQRVRIRKSSRAAVDWGVPHGAEGAVMCHYRVVAARQGAGERLDVKFSSNTVVWGAPASEFEVVG